MTDINKLEELAKAASNSTWRERGPYITAANPKAILSLISQYRRMEEALKAADAWLERWASHVGACRGGGLCECGLTAIQYETRGALQDQDQ